MKSATLICPRAFTLLLPLQVCACKQMSGIISKTYFLSQLLNMSSRVLQYTNTTISACVTGPVSVFVFFSVIFWV